jgi:hypothetical protein
LRLLGQSASRAAGFGALHHHIDGALAIMVVLAGRLALEAR